MQARCLRSGLLLRELDVVTPSGTYRIEYSGRGPCDRVLVNGAVAAEEMGLFTFVAPRFEFRIGPWYARLEVRVWPWLQMRRFRLTVEDRVLYEESLSLPRLTPTIEFVC